MTGRRISGRPGRSGRTGQRMPFRVPLLAGALFLAPAMLAADSRPDRPSLHTISFTSETPGSTAVDLSYEVYGGGLHLLSLDTQAVVTAEAYEIVSRLETRGIADTLFRGKMDSQARGKMTPDGPKLLVYAQDYVGRFGERSVHIMRNREGSYDVTAEPEDGVHADGSLPANALHGTIDPLTASVFTALNQDAEPCSQVIPVFDGRRVFRLRFQPDGEEMLNASSSGAYAGPAVRCKVRYEAVAGYSRDWHIEEAKNPLRPFTIWIATFESAGNGEGAPARLHVPVRLLIETRYMNGVAHLSRAVIDGDERMVPEGAR